MPITSARIAFLEGRGVDAPVASIDLELVKYKARHPVEGLGWSAWVTETAEVEYKRFLTLRLRHPRQRPPIVPNRLMDAVWHLHLLDTRAYVADCRRVFRRYLHHHPYFGLFGGHDEARLNAAFTHTQAMYLAAFGEPMEHPP